MNYSKKVILGEEDLISLPVAVDVVHLNSSLLQINCCQDIGKESTQAQISQHQRMSQEYEVQPAFLGCMEYADPTEINVVDLLIGSLFFILESFLYKFIEFYCLQNTLLLLENISFELERPLMEFPIPLTCVLLFWLTPLSILLTASLIWDRGPPMFPPHSSSGYCPFTIPLFRKI